MTLEQIKSAVLAGKTVCWKHEGYVITHCARIDQWLIKCVYNNHCIGLTWANGKTMNGKPEDFFILEEKSL